MTASAAVVTGGLSAVMLPKVSSAGQMAEINRLLLEAEKRVGLTPGGIAVIPIIESALAVENALLVAQARTVPRRLFTLAFGAVDYTLDVGVEITATGEELAYPRSRVVVACRAAGVEPPLDTPFVIDLQDREALEADIRRAKQLGFQGKQCIHPNQVEPCNKAFSPTSEEIERARKVIDAFEAAEAAGSASIQLEGKFIDYPVVERARRVVKMVEEEL